MSYAEWSSQVESLKKELKEAIAEAEAYSEPFDKKIAHYQELMDQEKTKRNHACYKVWGKVQSLRSRIWEVEEKIRNERFMRTMRGPHEEG